MARENSHPLDVRTSAALGKYIVPDLRTALGGRMRQIRHPPEGRWTFPGLTSRNGKLPRLVAIFKV